MNELAYQARTLLVSGAVFCVAVASLLAAEPDSTAATNAPAKAAIAATPDSSASAPATDAVQAKLPSGAADVVKLSRAKVSEDVVLSFVQNSGSAYSLSADDIVQMRKEGVSDRVINAMLDHHMKAVETAQQAVPAPVPAAEDPSANSAPPPAAEAASTSEKPAAVEAPLTPSGSSVTVIPYPAATSAYYGYYGPYYYPYYYGPVVSFGFGYGGCYYGNGIRGVGGIHGGHR